jgi:hypothetical protein
MPSNLEPAEFYRREADRLRTMAAADMFKDVRDNLLKVARQYDAMATQAAKLLDHRFGAPFISAAERRRA